MLPNSSVYQFLHLKSRSNKNLNLEVLGRLHQVTHRALIWKYSNDSFPLNLSILHVAKGSMHPVVLRNACILEELEHFKSYN